jgi:hypothetical protein
LSWNDLLKRATIADTELEKLGLNPAKKFRVRRLTRDSSAILEYIAGYHQYEFCPSVRGSDSTHSSQRNANSDSVAKSREIIKLYQKLHSEHPHELLPLETSLPEELKFESRDKYRIILTMILSQRMGDLQLINCLVKLFSNYPNFESLRLLPGRTSAVCIGRRWFRL